MSLRSIGENGAPAALRVAYVVKRFPRLSETFILNEILELERQGVEVSVFSLRPPTDEPRHRLLLALRAKVTYLTPRDDGPTDPGGHLQGPSGVPADLMLGKSEAAAKDLLTKARALADAIVASKLAHIHAHFSSDTTTVACLASRWSGVPFSFTAHARDIYHTYVTAELDTRVRRAKLQAAAFAVTVSDYNRRHLAALAGGKTHRVYNGIDLNCFQLSDAASREPDLILAVGRLVEKKGFSDLIAALGHLKTQGRDAKCIIVGDGPLGHSLAAQSEALGLGSRLDFAGAMPQDEVLHLMRHATVLALPCLVTPSGDRDGLPTVLLEALACGLPAISTYVAGIPEIIASGETGLLVPPNDPVALASALNHILSDAPFARALARAGRRKAERDFDLRKNVTTLRHLFSETSRPALAAETISTRQFAPAAPFRVADAAHRI